jgi:hypothetical protein
MALVGAIFGIKDFALQILKKINHCELRLTARKLLMS